MTDRPDTAAKADAPPPDDARKPRTPTQLRKPSWRHVLRTTVGEFADDQCTDLAAALTYYGVLALFPALIALVSVLGLVGQGQQTTDALLDVVRDVAPGSAGDTLEGIIDGLVTNQAAGLGLVLGLLGALWSASGFVGAFGRAMNRIYEVDEGRPFWKLRPTLLVVTVVEILLVAIAALLLALSGPVAQAVGDAIGLGDAAITTWNIAKWPVLALVVVLVIAILYHFTPNVRQPRFRWLSWGALLAILVWLVASVGFGLYVGFSSGYDKTYGSLAGVVVFLLWLWLSNVALLFGAEFDAELERARELQAGLPAEETIQLPPRDTRTSDKKAAKARKTIERGRRLRESGGRDDRAGRS